MLTSPRPGGSFYPSCATSDNRPIVCVSVLTVCKSDSSGFSTSSPTDVNARVTYRPSCQPQGVHVKCDLPPNELATPTNDGTSRLGESKNEGERSERKDTEVDNFKPHKGSTIKNDGLSEEQNSSCLLEPLTETRKQAQDDRLPESDQVVEAWPPEEASLSLISLIQSRRVLLETAFCSSLDSRQPSNIHEFIWQAGPLSNSSAAFPLEQLGPVISARLTGSTSPARPPIDPGSFGQPDRLTSHEAQVACLPGKISQTRGPSDGDGPLKSDFTLKPAFSAGIGMQQMPNLSVPS
ncbi:unnamed protein product [Protopolystoma xenopodis]|uniref:Uncharacterized protein n=1 Tax=Protopolystoma xenopodis TaxID=117903 RepID=A0A448XDV0_9PLAT|nr:unnamed protein product [Protopolystoma xenopodis]